MVHYIRFLRVPRIEMEPNGGSVRISAVLTVTTDLGESYYPEDLELLVHLVPNEEPALRVFTWSVFWHKNSQVTKLDLRHRSFKIRKPFVLHVSTRKTDDSWAECRQIPEVLDVWSSTFFLNVDCSATDFVFRKMPLTNATSINIQEATGESIALHIWDGAIGCLELYKHTLLLKDAFIVLPLFNQLLFRKLTKKLKVVELGSGCGVAGIALAQIVPDSRVLLTDLSAAQDIIAMNIMSIGTSLPKGSYLKQEVLDWEEPLSETDAHQKVDLLIVCECIYNADTCPILISMLQQFINFSPDVKILVVTKRRHDSETVFFDLMVDAGIEMLERCFILLPHHISDEDPETPQAEIYLFGTRQNTIIPEELLNGEVIPKKSLGTTEGVFREEPFNDNGELRPKDGDSPARPKKRIGAPKAASKQGAIRKPQTAD